MFFSLTWHQTHGGLSFPWNFIYKTIFIVKRAAFVDAPSDLRVNTTKEKLKKHLWNIVYYEQNLSNKQGVLSLCGSGMQTPFFWS